MKPVPGKTKQTISDPAVTHKIVDKHILKAEISNEVENTNAFNRNWKSLQLFVFNF